MNAPTWTHAINPPSVRFLARAAGHLPDFSRRTVVHFSAAHIFHRKTPWAVPVFRVSCKQLPTHTQIAAMNWNAPPLRSPMPSQNQKDFPAQVEILIRELSNMVYAPPRNFLT